KALTITAPTTTNKTYDGTNAITVTAGNLSGFVNSETVTATASGTTSDGDAGTGKYVTVSYNLANGNGGGLASNYSLANGSGSVNISPKTLTMTTISVADKIYDGDNSASVSATGLTGFVNSETVTALVQGNFADANAGSNKNVSVTFALANGTNGGKANNYQLASVTRQADITQKALSISGTSVSDKIYDATTNASVTTGTVTGLVGTQTLGITSTGSFANAAVGNGKTVSVSYNLANGTNGGLASNYSLAGQSQSADISFRALGLSGTVIANKTYDGSDTANITSVGSLTNIAGSDDVSLDSSGVSAKFDSINAGTQTVTLTGLSLTGSTASNYSFTLPSVSGVISKKALQITNSVALSKSYDANRVAVINPGTLSGFVGSQTVEVDASGLFANAQPGKDKSVLVTYYLKNGINGGLASNYSLSGETLTADIEGRTKEKADITAPMVEKQVEIVKNDVKIEREEKLEMIEQVELKVLEQETVSSAFVDTVGDWTILSCETSSANQGMCSAK
ncbi:MAG: YDG domain-containing protein, partial [Candidatus Puniceispirillaceae bacterium]